MDANDLNVNVNDLDEKVQDSVRHCHTKTPTEQQTYLRNLASMRVQQACGHWVTEDWLDVRELLILAADYLRAADRIQYVDESTS